MEQQRSFFFVGFFDFRESGLFEEEVAYLKIKLWKLLNKFNLGFCKLWRAIKLIIENSFLFI
jgi:hypothetical protein